MLSKLFRRIFAVLLCGLLFLLDPSLSARADINALNGSPVWSKVSFDNMGVVGAANYGVIDDPSLINQIGYNPSRAFDIGTPVSQTIKVGDLDIFGLGNKTVGAFLGGADPNTVSLGEFKAINGNSLSDLAKSVPGLSQIPASSIPLVQSILSGNNSGIASNALPLLQQVSPEIKNYLSANPWAKDLPLEQLMQGDWQGAAFQGALKAGLPKLVEQFPALKNIPLGGILSAASTGNTQALVGVGLDYGMKKAQESLGEFLKDNPALANLPIGTLTNINNLSLGSVPNLANTALTSIPGVKNQIVQNVPGLANVPLDSLLGLIKAAIAKIDFPDAGAKSATRALTGGGYSFASTPCTTEVCPNFEINDAKALLFSDQLNGLQFVVGSLDAKKGQSVKGGKGPLAKMFNGKEPVHIRPWGDGPNVAMAATKVDDVKGTASFAFYLRVCADIPFYGRSCTPYAIGPIPFTTLHEGETVVIQSAGQPPINASNFTGSPCGDNAPSVDPNAPLSQQNIKRYLDRIALGESTGGTNNGASSAGALGKYQFIPTTRALILEKYGYDGLNPAQWDNASIALIKEVGGQQTLNRIAAGDFAYADAVLNKTWTSLPGGAEHAGNANWQQPNVNVTYGPVNASTATLASGTSGTSTSATLVASNSASICGAPVPCKEGQSCILLNPNPKGKIPSYGGMYDACRDGCSRRHAGVDLQSPKGYQNWQRGPGENIRAAADGTVTELTPVGGRCGGIVGIKHPNPNLETRYVHMVQTLVSKGQPVKRGQFVGVEGNETPEGCGSSGTHLHYEIYIGGTATNPVKVKHDPPLPTAPG